MNKIIPENASTRALDVDRWIEVHLEAIIHNIQIAKKMMKDDCRLMAVIKADAYGLGAVEVAGAIEHMDEVAMLGVANVEEAILLRQNHIKKPILVFSPVNHLNAALIRAHHLIGTVDSAYSIQALAEAGEGPYPCHLKINTGMNRFGVLPSEAWEHLALIDKNPHLELQGIYTYLSKSTGRKGAALNQIKAFADFIKETDKLGIPRGMAHMADSAAFIRFPGCHMDMVRLGSFILGQVKEKMGKDLDLRNPYYAYARVLAIHDLQKGDPVGYGADYISPKKQRIAIIGAGYYDGFAMEAQDRDLGMTGAFLQLFKSITRIVANKPRHYASWQDKKLTSIGRVGMKFTAVRIYKYPIVIGDALSLSLKAISVHARIRRYYYQNGAMVGIKNDNQ